MTLCQFSSESSVTLFASAAALMQSAQANSKLGGAGIGLIMVANSFPHFTQTTPVGNDILGTPIRTPKQPFDYSPLLELTLFADGTALGYKRAATLATAAMPLHAQTQQNRALSSDSQKRWRSQRMSRVIAKLSLLGRTQP